MLLKTLRKRARILLGKDRNPKAPVPEVLIRGRRRWVTSRRFIWLQRLQVGTEVLVILAPGRSLLAGHDETESSQVGGVSETHDADK